MLHHPGSPPELPNVDERLVAPESRHEIEDGRVVYVPPADEPHAETHARLAAILAAHKAETFSIAVDMLTRTSRIDDLAPDVSVYPTARDPRTGGRQLEHLAFEITSTESLGHAGARAVKLHARGVRRVFAIDVARGRVLEWSAGGGAWSVLDLSSTIVDPALAAAMPIGALVDAARADDTIAHALRTRRHPEFLAERAEGRAEGRALGAAEARAEGRAEAAAQTLLAMLDARGLAVTDAERARILSERDLARLVRWCSAAASAADVAAMLAIA